MMNGKVPSRKPSGASQASAKNGTTSMQQILQQSKNKKSATITSKRLSSAIKAKQRETFHSKLGVNNI